MLLPQLPLRPLPTLRRTLLWRKQLVLGRWDGQEVVAFEGLGRAEELLLYGEACRPRRVILPEGSFCSRGSEPSISNSFIQFFAEFTSQIKLISSDTSWRHGLQFDHLHLAVLLDELIDVHVSTANSNHRTAVDNFHLDLSGAEEVLALRQSLHIEWQVSLVQMRDEQLVYFITLDGFVLFDNGPRCCFPRLDNDLLNLWHHRLPELVHLLLKILNWSTELIDFFLLLRIVFLQSFDLLILESTNLARLNFLGIVAVLLLFEHLLKILYHALFFGEMVLSLVGEFRFEVINFVLKRFNLSCFFFNLVLERLVVLWIFKLFFKSYDFEILWWILLFELFHLDVEHLVQVL